MSARDLPPTTTTGPDAEGIITVTTYRYDDEGKILRTVRRLRQSKIQEQLPARVIARRKWAKFGQAVDDPIDITVRDIDERTLNVSGKPKEEEKQEEPLATGAAASIVVCRNCGNSGHWTRNCPMPSKAGAPLGAEDNDPLAELLGTKSPASAAADAASPAAADGKYVPKHRQGSLERAAAQGGADRVPMTSIRISNLPEEVTEDLVQELARKYGSYCRVFLARDQDDPSKNRGFAYVHYQSEEDALAAQKGLHKKGMLNHILHVELSKPRERADADRHAVQAAAQNMPSARPQRERAPWRQ